MDLITYFPFHRRKAVASFLEKEPEEIRIRVGKPIEFVYAEHWLFCGEYVKEVEMKEMLNYLTDYSIYQFQKQMRQGFFTMKGGHRIGVVGHMTMDGHLAEIGAINIRVAGKRGESLADDLWQLLEGEMPQSIMIFSPPGVGKTTVLRELILRLSDSYKVAVVDERSELAACYRGIPQMKLGNRIDVMDNCDKREGMRLLLRSMSPEFIAVDELGTKDEFEMFSKLRYCGIQVIGTIHASEISEVMKKPYISQLAGEKVLKRFVGLEKNQEGKRTFTVYNEEQEILTWGLLEMH